MYVGVCVCVCVRGVRVGCVRVCAWGCGWLCGGVWLCVCVCVVVAVVFVVNRYWGIGRLMNMCMNLAGPVWGKVKEADTIRYI